MQKDKNKIWSEFDPKEAASSLIESFNNNFVQKYDRMSCFYSCIYYGLNILNIILGILISYLAVCIQQYGETKAPYFLSNSLIILPLLLTGLTALSNLFNFKEKFLLNKKARTEGVFALNLAKKNFYASINDEDYLKTFDELNGKIKGIQDYHDQRYFEIFSEHKNK